MRRCNDLDSTIAARCSEPRLAWEISRSPQRFPYLLAPTHEVVLHVDDNHMLLVWINHSYSMACLQCHVIRHERYSRRYTKNDRQAWSGQKSSFRAVILRGWAAVRPQGRFLSTKALCRISSAFDPVPSLIRRRHDWKLPTTALGAFLSRSQKT